MEPATGTPDRPSHSVRRLRRGLSTEQAAIRPRTELSREKDVYRYLHAWTSLHRPAALYRHAFPHQDHPLPTPEVCSDTALTSFAQLCALRMHARRALITLISGGVEYVLAEATQTMSLQYDAAEDAEDGPWLGCCCFPRSDGINDLAIEAWRKARRYRVLPDPSDAYYKEGQSPHFFVVSDARHDESLNSRAFVKRASPSLRFFCSIPIRDAQGSVLGALSVLDDKPRYGVSATEMLFLEDSADTITSYLDSSIVRSQQQRSERHIQALGLFNNHKSSLREWWIGQDDERLRKGGRYHVTEADSSDQRQARMDHEFGVKDRAGSNTSIASARRLRRQESAESSEQVEQINSPTSSANLNAASSRETQHIASTDFGSRPAKQNMAVPEFDTRRSSEAEPRESPKQQDEAPLRGVKPDSDNFDLAREIERAYARASNLICEAMSAEGVIFVDAKAASATLKGKPSGPAGSSTTSTGSEATSGGQTDGTAQSQSEDNASASDQPTVPRLCTINGYSTRHNSTLAGTGNGQSRRLALSESELRSFIKRYPRGKVFNFAGSGGVYASSGEDPISGSSEDNGTSSQLSSTSGLRKTRASRDATKLGKVLRGAKTIAFLPIWDDVSGKAIASVLVWCTTPMRFFNPVEDITYMAAFSHSLTAELARLETIASDVAKGRFTACSRAGQLSRASTERDQAPSYLPSAMNCARRYMACWREQSYCRAQSLRGSSRRWPLRSQWQAERYSTRTLHSDASLRRTHADTYSVDHVLDYSKISSRPKFDRKRPSQDRIDPAGAEIVDLASLTEDLVGTVTSAYRYQGSSALRGSEEPTANSSSYASLDNDEIAVVLNIEKMDSWLTSARMRGPWTRIVNNLVGNSLKYTKSGVVAVTLSASKSSQNSTCVKLVVQDTGIGMSEAFLTGDLYTPYKQADHNSSGTGLGLSIVKRIARDIRARINVESELGKGTKTSLLLDLSILAPSTKGVSEEDKQLSESLAAIGPHYFHMYSFDAASQLAQSRGAQAVAESVARTATEWLHSTTTSGPRCDFTARPSVCAIAETDLVHLARTQPKHVTALMSEMAAQDLRLIVMSHSLNSTTPSIRFEDFAVQPVFVHQPIGPKKLLRAITAPEDSSVPRSANPSSLYNNTSGPATSLRIRGDGSMQGEGECFPWNTTLADDEGQGGHGAGSTSKRTASISSMSDVPSQPGETVLVVEDNPINMQLLKALMHKLSIPTDHAVNGAEAVATYSAEPAKYFLVLTDISMPVMDGNEATAKIRAFERARRLPRVTVVAITGVTSGAARKVSLDSGVDKLFTKPVRMKEVKELVDEVRMDIESGAAAARR
ncbi:hypothetical protein LTR53_005414 [Teratosphaeriaceae sp. CCFEE 6253]|nr:hypothetical protein LTR53_005414 [Teratosphaeriaceae sp. CCFEE 6253]